jgi:carbon monoxide dehydrogenase subunit G
MIAEGALDILCPETGVIRALRSPDVLQAILPGAVSAEPLDHGTTRVRIEHAFGPLPVKAEPVFTLENVHDTDAWRLTISLRSLMFGTATVRIDLQVQPIRAGTALRWWLVGIDATGMAGKLLSTRGDRAGEVTGRLFRRLKHHLEAGPA